MATSQAKRKSEGRKKIEMKLIEDKNARTVTFSKRRAGLFKKATELSILCGAQIAIIVFSLTGRRVYSFGHPNVESVVGRFFNRFTRPNLQGSAQGSMARSALIADLKEECDRKNKEAKIKKRRGKELQAALESSVLSNEKMSQLDLNELQGLKENLVKLRDDMQRMAAARQSDGAGPSRTRCVDDVPELSSPDQIVPASVVVAEPSSPDQIVPASVVVTEPSSPDQINPASVVVAEPSNPKEINLANVEATPIPADWLKIYY